METNQRSFAFSIWEIRSGVAFYVSVFNDSSNLINDTRPPMPLHQIHTDILLFLASFDDGVDRLANLLYTFCIVL